jgi:hypothetical protein
LLTDDPEAKDRVFGVIDYHPRCSEHAGILIANRR